MANFRKCRGDGCPIREDCYRYTAPDDEAQVYFVDTPGFWSADETEWYCEYYRRKEGRHVDA